MNANIWNYGNTFDATISNREIDENGRLRVRRSLITKESVDKYYGSEIPDFESFGLSPEKVYNVYRPAGELEKALAKFKMLPLLDKHLMDFSDIPQRDNWVGVLGDCEIENGAVFGELSVWDKEAIKDIESEIKRDLSLGYCAKYELISGNFNGVHYDLRMKDIVPNHLALVENGRVKGAAVFDSENEGNPNHDKGTGRFTSKNGGSAEGNSQKQRKLSPHLEKLRNEAVKSLKNEKPIAEIKGDEFKGETIEEKRENARKYFEKNLRNEEFENKSLNKKIKILSGKKSFSEMGYSDKIDSIKYLPQILENSVLIRSAKETKGRTNIKEWHYLAAKIMVGNKESNEKLERVIALTIRQDNHGNCYYNHHIDKD